MPDIEIKQRTVVTNGVELHVLEAGSEGPLVVLAHGFPELAYSWRHQLPALASAGYRVVAPDQRGYGRSSRPEEIDAYDIHHLSADLLGVIDDLGASQAVLVGHDWGSIVVSHIALSSPQRVAGLVNMSVPHLPRPSTAPTAAMRNLFGETFFYILYFQELGVADAELGADPRRTIRRMLGGIDLDERSRPDPAMFAAGKGGFIDRIREPPALPEWLSEQELEHYVAEFSRTGFTGGINWYRNLDRNWETTEALHGAVVRCPSLFIGGSRDPVSLMSPPGIAHDSLTCHRGDVIIDGAGHWVQQQDPQSVNRALLRFLGEIHI